MDHKAPRKYRLCRRTDIDAVFAEGVRARNGLAMLVARPNGLDYSRVAVAVSKRHGNAVQRNRIKRLCREAARLTRPDIPAGWDFVILPRLGARLTMAGLRDSFASLVGRAVRAKTSGRQGGSQQ